MVEKLQGLTINEVLKKSIDILGKGDYFNPLLDAQILLMHVLDVEKIYLYTHGDQVLDKSTVDRYFELVKLRKTRYPLQYITGKQEFMGLDFKVKPGILVPRPDTETLVEKIIEIVEDGYFADKAQIKIADIGTGSGAITLSLAKYIENSFLYSVDINPDAIDIATENAISFGLQEKVEFLKGNLLEPLKAKNLQSKIDILVSNPPYIASEVIEKLQVEVSKYEPKLALDGGEDGLDFYRAIIKDAGEFLSDKSILAFEIGYDQGLAVKNLIKQTQLFETVDIITDLSGQDRVVIGTNKQVN